MSILIKILLTSLFVFSQKTMPDSAKNEFEALSQQGSLFALKVVKGQPIKIFVIGREEAEIDLSKIELAADLDISNLSLSIRQTNPKPGKILKIKRIENHFEIAEPIAPKNDLVIEIQDTKKDKKETFKIKMDPLK